jgi:elongation factor G
VNSSRQLKRIQRGHEQWCSCWLSRWIALRVELNDGSFHAVDSDALSFELCAKMAYREALPKCKPVILEPIMKLEVVTPSENMGDVIGDLNKRRGMIEGTGERNNATVINAKVPLSEMFGYVTDLRTITSGRATSSMEFSNYSRLLTTFRKL